VLIKSISNKWILRLDCPFGKKYRIRYNDIREKWGEIWEISEELADILMFLSLLLHVPLSFTKLNDFKKDAINKF
jgi:hypothetical protein